jgi:hypothetical protein
MQVTKANLENISVFDLYKHYAALEASLPLLTNESKELVKDELEYCLDLRSQKIDRLYYAWSHHEDAIRRAKEEEALLKQQRKYHENQVTGIKRLVVWLRTVALRNESAIKGKDYQFLLRRIPNLKVEIKSSIDEWSHEERKQFCVVETVTTTKHSVLTSLTGEVLNESSTPVTKSEIIPNLDAIRNAYQEGQHLPKGVKVYQDYSVTRKRILVKTKQYLGSIASEYPAELLSELDHSDKQ